MMKELTIGCIGCGNMGGAILSGLSRNQSLKLIGYDPQKENLAHLQHAHVESAKDIEHVAIKSDIIIVAVKPKIVEQVLPIMMPVLTKDKLIISVAAGISTKKLQEGIQKKCAVMRCMPNTPAMVGAGVFAFCCEDPLLEKATQEKVFSLFQNIGMCIELAEKSFTAFSAFMGAGPAYVFYLMNALTQAGVTLGFSRAESRHMVEQLVEGSVKMSKSSASNITELRDNVCSPGGLTIAGINHLERNAISGHIVDAILAANKRGKEMED